MEQNGINELKNIDLLYLEDDKDTREEVSFFLKKRVKNLYVGTNGEEGYALYSSKKPDIILTDINMPKMDGIRFCEKIRFDDHEIPIIIISAYNTNEYLYKAIDLSVTTFLNKPLNLKKMSSILVQTAKKINLKKENIAIKNTLEQYKSIVDVQGIVSKTDAQGYITYVNQPFIDISGYTQEELIGMKHTSLKSIDTSQKFIDKLWHILSVEKCIWKGKLKCRKKNGDVYYVDTVIQPIFDVDKNIVEFISFRHDVTELEKKKIFLEHQNNKQNLDLNEAFNDLKQYENAINESNIVSRTDLDGIITYANRQFVELSGYSKKELMGASHNIVRHKDVPSSVFRKMWDTIKSGQVWKGTIKNRAKDGSSYYVDATIVPIYNKHNIVVEYLAIRHDVTQIINLHKELEETQREVIYKLGEISETRCKETGFHVRRVAEYSKLLGNLYGMNYEEVNLLYLASPMHDIGKIGIPDEILNKPGKLTSYEWEIMKGHSDIGYRLLKNSHREIFKTSAIIAYEHHEKWDGSGYPQELSGEDIHIYGRITAIADVLDALGSKRCYKEEWELDRICNYFKEQKAKHFDPILVDLFLDNIDSFLEIKKKYMD